MEAARQSRWMIALALAILPAAWTPLPPDPAAVLVHSQGAVEVRRAGASTPSAARIGMDLFAGDLIVVGSGGRAVLLYRTGKLVEAKQPHRVEEPAGESRSGLFQQTMRTLTQVATVDAGSRPNRQGMIRPIPGQPDPIDPGHDLALLGRSPIFTWYRVDEAPGYVLQLRRDGERPRRYTLGADTTWALPDSLALEPGSVYEWTVAAQGEGRPGVPQRFRVASEAEKAAVEARLSEIRAGGIDPGGSGRFLAAVVYRDAGFPYSADEQLRALDGAGAQGAAFHRVWAEVLSTLGRDGEARRQLERSGGGN